MENLIKNKDNLCDNSSSNQPSFRVEKIGEKSVSGISPDNKPDPTKQPLGNSLKRLSRSMLEELAERLSDRDKEILKSIKKYRFLMTNQIQRLYFINGTSKSANTRATNRALKKLREYHLITSLERRIGGVRAGSAALIWHLTEPGHRLLTLGEDNAKRTRFKEPSALFLEHTLAVAETAVQIANICRPSEDLELIKVDPEPTCWRFFKKDHQTIQLKPDLFAITTYDDYEDQWFIEIDLGTESSSQVVEKCRTYRDYYYTGIEQAKNQLFPLVVWLVPTKKRKNLLRRAILEKLSTSNSPKMFLIITPRELETLLRQYIEQDELC